jgi:putative endonuclease
MEREQKKKMYVCYLLVNETNRRTYIGITTCLQRRLRQHNGLICGGAKYTRSSRPWRVHCFVSSFCNKSMAMRFEWKWKRMGRGVDQRMAGVGRLLACQTQWALQII